MTARRDRVDDPESRPGGRPLRLEGVALRRGGAAVLSGIDACFEADRSHVLLGPSGAGKSSLLRLLNRLEDPTEGRVLLGDAPLPSLPSRALRRAIALVVQDPRPLPGSLRDNLHYPDEAAGLPPSPDGELVAALDECGLPGAWLDRDAAGLSGGERRRLALAVALRTGPEILLLDEPTAGLDRDSASRIVGALRRRVGEGLRTIVATHVREDFERLGDRAVGLLGGRVVAEGEPGAVLEALRRDRRSPSGVEEAADAR